MALLIEDDKRKLKKLAAFLSDYEDYIQFFGIDLDVIKAELAERLKQCSLKTSWEILEIVETVVDRGTQQ